MQLVPAQFLEQRPTFQLSIYVISARLMENLPWAKRETHLCVTSDATRMDLKLDPELDVTCLSVQPRYRHIKPTNGVVEPTYEEVGFMGRCKQ